MKPIRKKIVADESMRPVAVQIDYADWLEVERLLGLLPTAVPDSNGAGSGIAAPTRQPTDLNRFAGTLTLKEDPLASPREG